MWPASCTLSCVRITDIVNQNAARATANQRISQRLSEQRQAQQAQALEDLQFAQQSQESEPIDRQVTLVRPEDFTGEDGYFPASTGDEDEPLGAIVERFVRQRSIMSISLPFATGGGNGVNAPVNGYGNQGGLFNLTLEVEETYRVIEFIPRSEWLGQSVDVQA